MRPGLVQVAEWGGHSGPKLGKVSRIDRAAAVERGVQRNTVAKPWSKTWAPGVQGTWTKTRLA